MKTYAKISHSWRLSEKRRAGRRLFGEVDWALASACWYDAVVVSSYDLTDGLIYLDQLYQFQGPEVVARAVEVLTHPDVGLWLRVDTVSVRIADYEEHNRCRWEVEELKEKRRAAGAAGGKKKSERAKLDALASAKANARHVATTAIVANAKQPVSASASAPDPEFGDGVPAALAAGFRNAFAERFGGHRAATIEPVPAELVHAVEHEATLRGCDPSEVALPLADSWMASRRSAAVPRWRFFLEDASTVLLESRTPQRGSEGPSKANSEKARPFRITERDGTVVEVNPETGEQTIVGRATA